MLRAHLCAKIPLPKGMNVVVGVQVLIEHDWAATTGYCMKDAGLPHYECEAHNMFPEFLEHCKDKYKRMKLTHEQGKELVTPNTFFKNCTRLNEFTSVMTFRWLPNESRGLCSLMDLI